MPLHASEPRFTLGTDPPGLRTASSDTLPLRQQDPNIDPARDAAPATLGQAETVRARTQLRRSSRAGYTCRRGAEGQLVCCFAQGQENEPLQAQKEIEQMSYRDCDRELRIAGVSKTKEAADGKMVTITDRAGLRELVAKLRAGNAPARKQAQSTRQDWAEGLGPQKTFATTVDLADAKAAVEVAKQKIVTQKIETQKIETRAVPAPHMLNVVNLAEALCTPGLPKLLGTPWRSSGSLSGALQRARLLGLMPTSNVHPLSFQVLEVPELQAFEKVPGSMTRAELLPALVAAIDHYSTQWNTLGREQRVQWLAGHLQHTQPLPLATRGVSQRCREKAAAWSRNARLHGFSSEENNKKRSKEAHLDLIFCHGALTRSKGLTGNARQPSRPEARRPCGSRKVALAQEVLWNRARDALARHITHGTIEHGTDMLAALRTIPGASDGGELPSGHRCPSSQSMDILHSQLAVTLDAPVLPLHGAESTGVPLLNGAQLVNVRWGTLNVSTPEQVAEDAHVAVSIMKDSLRDEDGKLHFDAGGRRLQGEAFFGLASLRDNQTLTVYSTNGNRSEAPDLERSDSVLQQLAACGPAFAELTTSLRKARDSRPTGKRILRIDGLFYMTDDDLSAFAEGFWHARC